MSRKAIAMKSLKEKWLSIVQSAKEKGEKGIGGSSTVTPFLYWNMSSSSNSSPSCPGPFNSQRFHHVFPAALPRQQHNILYASILQQPPLIAQLEWQSSYKDDESIQSLVHVFHHLSSTQIDLNTLEPHTDHVVSSTLHIAATMDDTMDLLHNQGFHHHILSLPPDNVTLGWVFCPIYHTLMAVERDAYEESDLRVARPPILHELHLTIPAWAQNPSRLQRLIVFSAIPQAISVSTAPSMNVPAVVNKLPVIHNTTVSEIIAPSVSISPTWPVTVPIDIAPSVTPPITFSSTVLLQRTQAQVSSSITEILRGFYVVPVVQVFKGGIVMVQGCGLILSIIHLPPLTTDSSFTFTVLIIFFTDTFQYIVW